MNKIISRINMHRVFALPFLVILFYGCAKEARYTLKPPDEQSPSIVYCFDTVGHTPGAKPWVLGGTCCCTPSEKVLSDYKKSGHIAQDMTLDGLKALYETKGIKTALDHQGCNNMCKWGPHVVKGGKCMVPPAPMTMNYEEIFSGTFKKPEGEGKKPGKS